MIFLSVLFAAAQPASLQADDPITAYLRGCGHVEGPLRFKSVDGGDKQAFACTAKGKTRVAVFTPLPSGQQGRQCDSLPVAGTANVLAYAKVAGTDVLHLRVVNSTPDDERVIEQALSVRWGACKVIAESNVLHPLEGPTLREPRAGLEIDEQGIDAWTEVARIRFGADRRKVAIALRGVRVTPGGAALGEEIEAEPYEPVELVSSPQASVLDGAAQPFTLAPGGRATFAFAPAWVRGVRVRFTGAFLWPLSITMAHQTVQWRDKQDWQSRSGIFGFGFLAQKGPAVSREAVVFFDPPLESADLELSVAPGKGEPLAIESVRVLRDVKEWPPFQESEDFGERESN